MMLGLLDAPPLARVPEVAPPALLLLFALLEFLAAVELLDWPLAWARSGGSVATNAIPPIASDAIAMN
jgi:hypothetical protein